MDSSADPARQGSSGAGRVPLRLEQHDGESALFIPRWSAPVRLGVAIMVVLVVAAVVAAGLAFLRGSPALGVVLLVLAALVAGVLARNMSRNPFNGGVWLTPTSLSTSRGRDSWTVPWDDVVSVAYAGSQQDIGIRSRSDGAERVISSHLLVMAPGAVMTLIDLYSHDSARRSELGTERCLDEAGTVRAAYGGTGFRPVVQGSPTATRGAMFTGALVLAGLVLALAALGRASSVDDDALADSIRDRLVSQGAQVTEVSCDGAIRKKAGETQDCVATVDGRQRDFRVEVTAVEGDRVGYRVTER